MPADNNLSIEEILAACRRADSGGGAPSEDDAGGANAAAESVAASQDVQPSSESVPASEKQPGEMSAMDVLAAARAEKKSAEKESGAAPTGKPASGKKSGAMSVADMLAAARSEKSAGKAQTKPADAKDAADQAGAKGTSAKASPKPAAKAKSDGAKSDGAKSGAKAGGPKDTASILAAARGAAKPGPITKAEAAARAQVSSPPAKQKLSVPPMPERPAYARPSPPPQSTSEDRRGFFAALAGVFVGSSLAVGFSSLAVTHVLWLLGLARFMFPNILTEPPTQFKVGFPDELAPGQVETKYKAEFGVWIVRYEYDGQPQIYAIQSVCTHLGCTPNWLEGEQKFKCPCHGSGFYKDGINFEGPAPRPLERFAIRTADDGQLEVDKSRKFKEEVGQWEDAASFVPV